MAYDAGMRMYEPGKWFNAETAEDMAQWYPELSRLHVYECAGSLSVLERFGKLPRRPSNVVEFGSGVGEGLVALDMFVDGVENARVVGSEPTGSDRRTAQQVSELLPYVTGVEPDGLEVISSHPDGSVDLIFAHMFGSTRVEDHLLRELLDRALPALSKDGALLIDSDNDTMEYVIDYAQSTIAASQLTVVSPDELPNGFNVMPHLIVKSQYNP